MSGNIGIFSSQEKSFEWYTPEWVFNDLGIHFDLDPCSPIDFETHVPAKTKYTIIDNGLNKDWKGRVWLNPPYGKEAPKWMDRMIEHQNGIALVFSRTDSQWCQRAMKSADALLFLSGRIRFISGKTKATANDQASAGSLFLAWGEENIKALMNLKDKGFFVINNKSVI